MAEGQFRIVVSQKGVVRTANSLEKLVQSAERAEKAMGRLNAMGGVGLQKVARGARDANAQFNRLIGTIAAVYGASQVKQMIDGYTSVNNRLKYLYGTTEKATVIQNELFQAAQKTRTSFDLTAETFTRMQLATRTLGVSARDVIDATTTLNQTVALSGANSREAEAGIRQFTQALASGRLQGDEFRSVMENIPAVADLIAQSLGVQRGELYKLRKEGKLTADVLFNALLKYKDGVNQAFGETTPTIDQALTRLQNTVQKFFSEFAQNTGLVEGLVSGLGWVADNQRTLENAFIGLGAVIALAGARAAAPWMPLLAAFAAAGGSASFAVQEIRKAIDNEGTTTKDTESIRRDFKNEPSLGGAWDLLIDTLSGGEPSDTPLLRPGANLYNRETPETRQRAISRAQASGAMKLRRVGSNQSLFAEGNRNIDVAATPYDLATLDFAPGDYRELEVPANERFPSSSFLTERGEKLPPPPSKDAVNEWKKFLKLFESLRDELDPVGAATRAQAEDFKTLERAMSEGLIPSHAEYIEMLERVSDKHKDQIHPVQAIQNEIRKEIDLNQLAYQDREKTIALLEIEQELKKKWIEMTAEERAETEGLIEKRLSSARALELIGEGVAYVDGLLQESRTPAENYQANLAKVEQGARSGKYELIDYLEAIRLVKAEYEREQKEGTFVGKLEKETREFSDVMGDQGISAINKFADTWANFVISGKFQFKDFANSVIADLARIAAQQLLIGAVKFGISALTSSRGSSTEIMSNATGGSYQVGGFGGTDSQLYASWVSPGERVDVLTPAQQRAQEAAMRGGGNQPVVNTKVIVVSDYKQAALEAMNTEDGERVVIQHMQKNGVR
jgi:tape measure domain-containing protein